MDTIAITIIAGFCVIAVGVGVAVHRTIRELQRDLDRITKK